MFHNDTVNVIVILDNLSFP